VLTGRAASGWLWAAPLVGPAGFLDGQEGFLDVGAAPRPGDPLAALPVGQPVGMLAIDFATRRRMRVNGVLGSRDPGRLRISVEQAYGNCPQYIQQRDIQQRDVEQRRIQQRDVGLASARLAGAGLTPAQVRLIRAADTFFLGTSHPRRGADASHRGGPAGFVRVEGATLWWPDYPGNNMFNSLGNLAVDPAAGMLFVDFAAGETLHLSGTAEVEWDEPGSAGDDGHTGRRIRFTPRKIIQPAEALPIRAGGVRPWPYNPAVTR
jgi:predicted pyridoxine 5'-phosphate oxidase superfamily flavin-nucleotide-binding protein